jgi:hypothetical protein
MCMYLLEGEIFESREHVLRLLMWILIDVG